MTSAFARPVGKKGPHVCDVCDIRVLRFRVRPTKHASKPAQTPKLPEAPESEYAGPRLSPLGKRMIL